MGVIKNLIKIFKNNDKTNDKIDDLSENQRKYGRVTAKLIDMSEKRINNYKEYVKKVPQNLCFDKSVLDSIRKRRNTNGNFYFGEEKKSRNDGLDYDTQNKVCGSCSTIDESAFDNKDSIAYQNFRNNKWNAPIAHDTDPLDQMIREQEHERNRYANIFVDTDADRAIEQYHKDVIEDPLEFNRAMDTYNSYYDNDDSNNF